MLLVTFAGCGGGGGGGPSGSVQGVVVAATTRLPIEGATVDIAGTTTFTDSDGAFLMEGVRSDTSLGTAVADGYEETTFEFDPPQGGDVIDAGEVLLVVEAGAEPPPPPHTVFGEVTLSGETFHDGVTVEAVGTGESDFTDPQGRYYLWLPVGTYTIRASKLGFSDAQGPVTVADMNQPVERNFTLVRE